MIWLACLVLAVAAFLGGAAWGARRRRPSALPAPLPVEEERAAPPADDLAANQDPPAPAAAAASDGAEPASLETLLARLEQPYEDSSHHPTEVTVLPDFQAAAAILADPQRTTLGSVVQWATGADPVRAMVAAEALVKREDAAAATGTILDHLSDSRVWPLHGLTRFLARWADRPVIWEALLRAPAYWADNRVVPPLLSDMAEARMAAGEPLDPKDAIARRPQFSLTDLRALLEKLRGPAVPALRAALDGWERTRVDAAALAGIGRVWPGSAPPGADDDLVAHPALEQAARSVLDGLTATPPKSVVLVGDPGVGKSAVARLVAAELTQRGWTLFEAGAADIMAGQTYLGELEKRIRELLSQIDTARKVVWLVPAFHELAQAGRHRHSAVSVLDMVLGAVESGRIVVLGETVPAQLEGLLRQRPRLRFALSLLKIEALDDRAALDLAVRWMARQAEAKRLAADDDLAGHALELARSYLTSSALPGCVIDLLRQARQRVLAAAGQRLSRDDLLATLASITGLPLAVLDERAGLDPAALRDHFARRVMGQPEAVNCLVDRVAMLKAGLVDPRRPIGVFLFAGPTGTGKTEVAKTLATFLFGGAERLLRLDMSEFQDPSAMTRLVGGPGDDGVAVSLVQQIRKQPFAVVLLDEFEKAHPRVWDLFLQVFDDGRLTDAAGQVADFQHAIIILTSNVGATTHQAGSLGFTRAGAAFSEGQVARALSGLFRPEFLNRIDRVVVFRPLTKATMRDILRKELGDVVQRRGFRDRDWAVEWEPSAIDFLLERGFTPDMGARPLRRAIEEHLLAPLAMTIVEHRFPEGDQFLFVRSDGQAIQVEFIDPDGPAAAADSTAAEVSPADPDAVAPGLSLGRLVLAPRGDDEARRYLSGRLQALATRLDAQPWRDEKDALLAALNREGFWSAGDRFDTLDRLERMDRITAEAEGLQSLGRRLGTGRAPAASVVAGIAQRLHLVGAALADLDARRPGDAFVAVEAVALEEGAATSQAAGPAAGRAWARRVGRMYLDWASRRGLHVEVLDEGADGGTVLSVSGLGVVGLLTGECGLHVLETPNGREGRDALDRVAARVRVAPQPVVPSQGARRARKVALQCLASAASSAVVRRYREGPSPLVRDAVTGWRTGRLDTVLAGSFDLFQVG